MHFHWICAWMGRIYRGSTVWSNQFPPGAPRFGTAPVSTAAYFIVCAAEIVLLSLYQLGLIVVGNGWFLGWCMQWYRACLWCLTTCKKELAYATINEEYHRINRIEKPEDGGLGISYVYLIYKTMGSIRPHRYTRTHIPDRNSPIRAYQ